MSVITTTRTTFHDPLEELLKRVTARVDEVVAQVAAESYQFERHEEFTTSRLAQGINSSLRDDPIIVDGLTLEVHLEEFKAIQEKQTGADLYISLVRNDLILVPKHKGMLVQAKRRTTLLKSGEPRRFPSHSIST
jgi:hypothetical protein